MLSSVPAVPSAAPCRSRVTRLLMSCDRGTSPLYGRLPDRSSRVRRLQAFYTNFTSWPHGRRSRAGRLLARGICKKAQGKDPDGHSVLTVARCARPRWAPRGARRRMLGVGAAAVAVLGAGIPLVLSGSAGAHGTSHHASGQAAVIAKLPAQARHGHPRARARHRPDLLRRARRQAGQDQARLADHPREQVLRRLLHRAQQQHVPVEDASVPGRPAQELLRHRARLARQLPVAGSGSGAADRHSG